MPYEAACILPRAAVMIVVCLSPSSMPWTVLLQLAQKVGLVVHRFCRPAADT